MKTFSTTTALTLALFAFEACSDPGPISEADWDRLAGMRWGEMKAVDRPNAVAPTDLDSDKAATLGRLLFFDTKMSGSGNISCNTCHEASTSGADPRGLTSSM
ncbi:MAG: cytochrome c peroxidase, partial [Kiritimatiellia bacterium]